MEYNRLCKLTAHKLFFRLAGIYTPPVTAQFLADVSLRIGYGEMHGVMGASSSGKSTLLDVIASRVPGSIGGDILLNGQELSGERAKADEQANTQSCGQNFNRKTFRKVF